MKNVKKENSLQPKKSKKGEKIGGRREKSTVETLSKKWLFGLFCSFREGYRGKQTEKRIEN